VLRAIADQLTISIFILTSVAWLRPMSGIDRKIPPQKADKDDWPRYARIQIEHHS
jgi:hypothetical protein